MKASTGTILALLVCALASISASGCNTIRGAGKDIQKGGKAVENAAKNIQRDINAPRGQVHMSVASAESRGTIRPQGLTGVN